MGGYLLLNLDDGCGEQCKAGPDEQSQDIMVMEMVGGVKEGGPVRRLRSTSEAEQSWRQESLFTGDTGRLDTLSPALREASSSNSATP